MLSVTSVAFQMHHKLTGVVKVLYNVELFLFSRIFFENFQISQSDQCNFDSPQMPKSQKEKLCYTQMNPPPKCLKS